MLAGDLSEMRWTNPVTTQSAKADFVPLLQRFQPPSASLRSDRNLSPSEIQLP